MGQAKLQAQPIGSCIYCGSLDDLSKEHVLPYGLGGDLILKAASCSSCRKATSKLELRLLRGHWWPYRRFLGLKSRRPKEQVPDLQVKLKRRDGSEAVAQLPMAQQSLALVFELDPPSILRGEIRTDVPNAPRVYLKHLADPPSTVLVEGQPYKLSPDEKLEIPVDFDAADLCQFLAKVAHGYAISRRGLNACSKHFLPPLVLGETAGAQTYVGGASSPFILVFNCIS